MSFNDSVIQRVFLGIRSTIRNMGRWVLLFLIGLMVVIVISLLISPSGSTASIDEPTSFSNPRISREARNFNHAQTLFQRGISFYEAEQFFNAVQVWQHAKQAYADEGNQLGEALSLSHLSLAYQQLGRLDDAEQHLNDSLSLLADLNEIDASVVYSDIYAKVLNTQGKLYWNQGHLESALESWQQAAQFYARANNDEGRAIAQINQARALQTLGLAHQAETMLYHVYHDLSQHSNTELQAIGLRHLGTVLRHLGRLESSFSMLRESQRLTTDSEQMSLTLVELGNTERARGDRLMALGRQADALRHHQTALDYYQQSIDLDDSLTARLNRLSLQIAIGQGSGILQEIWALQSEIALLPSSRTAIDAAINVSESWIRFSEIEQTSTSESPSQPKLSSQDLASLLANAVAQAQELNDGRAESSALGQLGKLYEHNHQISEAQTLTQRALLTLESIDAPEIRYRWEWQLGRLAEATGDRPSAIVAYAASVATLQTVRENLLSTNPDVQISFRDDVEPVYREFIQLLLSDRGNSPNQEQLKQAILTVDSLQIAELENYLGCILSNVEQIDAIEAPNAAILYPILLSDRLVVITQLPNPSSQLIYRETPIAESHANTILQSLRANLARPDRTPEVIEAAQTVYDWLIRPIESELDHSSVDTLVFVLDGALRNVPMTVLYDGNQYLIEKGYAVAIAPRLRVFAPNPSSSHLRVLTGGIGIPQTIGGKEFPPIEKIQEELDRIAQYVETSPPLINEAFTTNNIRQQLQTDDFSAIHWKTHGVFSSDPSETYVVEYGDRISASELGELISLGSRRGTQPLELLVLSACETAQGDNRAVLGLAGLAARTGTRSVLSTLWTAQDTPNTEFMVQFYTFLSQSGTTKAEAVRQAQRAIFSDYGYTTPHIWANYVLIGNWL